MWLFSSGPLGRRPTPTAELVDVVPMISASGAMGHVTLGGKLDPADLGLAERLVARVTHAPVGDVRDWEAIDAWAEEIVRAAVAEQACGEMGS